MLFWANPPYELLVKRLQHFWIQMLEPFEHLGQNLCSANIQTQPESNYKKCLWGGTHNNYRINSYSSVIWPSPSGSAPVLELKWFDLFTEMDIWTYGLPVLVETTNTNHKKTCSCSLALPGTLIGCGWDWQHFERAVNSPPPILYPCTRITQVEALSSMEW